MELSGIAGLGRKSNQIDAAAVSIGFTLAQQKHYIFAWRLCCVVSKWQVGLEVIVGRALIANGDDRSGGDKLFQGSGRCESVGNKRTVGGGKNVPQHFGVVVENVLGDLRRKFKISFLSAKKTSANARAGQAKVHG